LLDTLAHPDTLIFLNRLTKKNFLKIIAFLLGIVIYLLYLCIMGDLVIIEQDIRCKKCGISTEYYNHNEKECDFVPIDWSSGIEVFKATHVKDIDISDIKIKTGYGVWEQVILTEIMTKLYWKARNSLGGSPLRGMSLFNKAKKIYDE